MRWLVVKYYFLHKADSLEKTPLTRMFPTGAPFTAESTERVQINYLSQGHNLLMQSGFEPSISLSRNRHLNHMANMLYCDVLVIPIAVVWTLIVMISIVLLVVDSK